MTLMIHFPVQVWLLIIFTFSSLTMITFTCLSPAINYIYQINYGYSYYTMMIHLIWHDDTEV